MNKPLPALGSLALGLVFHALSLETALTQFMDLSGIPSNSEESPMFTSYSYYLAIKHILTLLAFVAIVLAIFGSFRILTARKDKEKVVKGKKMIFYAIIGLLVIFFARVTIGFLTGELASWF